MNDAKTAKVFADLEKAEARMIRAFNKWAKLKAKVRRMDAKYAKELAESLPGKMDVRDMGIKAKPWPHSIANQMRLEAEPPRGKGKPARHK